MANLIRSAKAGNDWTSNELHSYNITVVDQTKEEFFGASQLPPPSQPSLVGFMAIQDRTGATDNETRKLLHYLDLALDPKAGEEAAVNNLVAKLLEKLEYDEGARIIFIQHELPLIICGKTSQVQTDVCVLDDNKVVLLVRGGLS